MPLPQRSVWHDLIDPLQYEQQRGDDDEKRTNGKDQQHERTPARFRCLVAFPGWLAESLQLHATYSLRRVSVIATLAFIGGAR